MKSTGDFHVSTEVTGEDSWASLVNSGEMFLPSQFSGGDNVFVFGGATPCASRSFAEGPAVADAAAIVDRKNDVAAAGQVLIHRIGIRVVIHVVPAEQHLTDRTAVHEDQRGFLFFNIRV